jgi:hypothetical protein
MTSRDGCGNTIGCALQETPDEHRRYEQRRDLEDPNTTITAELAECAGALLGWSHTAEAAAHAEPFVILRVLCVFRGERDLQRFSDACST